MKPIPYGRQHINDDDIAAVVEVLRSDFLTQGPAIEKFERAFAEMIGCRYAVALANGTAALHLAAMALGLKPGQAVVTTPITFAATANCARYCGAEVDFVDIDPRTYLMDLDLLREKLRKAPNRFAGILPVDFAGLPVDLVALRKIADEFGLWIIEDACHAPGAGYRGSFRSGDGQFADAAIFSFHPVKHIACGEGGMITTNRADVYEKLLLLRTHGITRQVDTSAPDRGGWYYEMRELGYNYRLSDMQAALGLSQLNRASAGLARRREIAAKYDDAFLDTKIIRQHVPAAAEHAYHLYVVQVPNRKSVYESLKKAGIYAQVHYVPVHRHPYYESLGWRKGDMPVAEAYYENCLSLPMFPTLTDAEQDKVIEALKQCLG